MRIGQVIPAAEERAERAEETADRVRTVGAGIAHEISRETGEAVLASTQDGVAWVERERVVLERASGRGRRARWGAVGGHRAARAQDGLSLREVGDGAAVCQAEYRADAGAPIKVRLEIRAAEAGNYRVRWSLAGIRGDLVEGALPHGLRFGEDDDSIEFDWSDVVAAHGDVVSVEESDGTADIIFGPFELAAGEAVELDPTIAAVYWSTCIAYNNARRTARTSDGKLYVVYYTTDASGYCQVYVKESSDDGQSWSNETKISTGLGQDTKHSSYCAIATDSRDDLHVVYYGKATGYSYYQIWHAWRKDGVWQTPVRISTADGMQSYHQGPPAITVDAADDLHAVWYGKATGYTSYNQIWWAACVRGRWQTPVRISTYSGMDSYAQSYSAIAGDGSGDLHVAWRGKATGYTSQNQVWYAEYLNGSWQTPVRISTYSGMDTNAQSVPCIAVDSDSDIHVVWYGRATGYTSYHQIWYAERTTNWQTPVRISTGTGMNVKQQYYPGIAVGAADDLHVLWEGADSTNTGRHVFHAKHDGSSWGTPRAETTTRESRIPNVRWNSFHNRGGSLDWIWLEGDIIGFWSGGDTDEATGPRKSQSFKATESRRLSRVRLRLKSDGTSQTATVGIYAADANGCPTGSELGIATATVSSSSYGDVYFNFWTQTINLTANSSYCIVCGGAYIYWQVDASSPGYADGNWAYWVGGPPPAHWVADTSKDGYFYVYPFFDIEFDCDTSAEPADVAIMSSTHFYYDSLSRQVCQRDGLGNFTYFQYDAAGRQNARVDGEKNPTYYDYDNADRLHLILYADNTKTYFNYDNADRRTNMIDEYGTVAWQYDDNGRPIFAQSHKGYTSYYEYDAAGRRNQMIDPDARVSYFNYDDASRLTQLLDGFSGDTTWEYEPIGVPKKQVLPNTMVSYYAYDDAGQLTEVEHRKSDLTLLVSAEQSYDAAGNITKIVREDDGYTYYNYDGLNQLTEEIQKNSGGTQLYGFVWSYDGAGNRKHQDRDTTLIYYSYDQANQLLRSITGAAWTYYQYDDNGNTIAEQITDGVTYYHYTPENRLSKVLSDIGGSVPNYFYYDGDQRRIVAEDSAGRTYFLYDGEKVAVEKNAAGTTQAAYVNQGPSIYHPLIYMDRAGTKSYHLFNHLGTTLALASAAQALSDTYRWNAWGVQLACTGSTTNPFGYVGALGYYRQPDSSDYWARARVYGPLVARWFSRDALASYAQRDSAHYSVRARAHGPTIGRRVTPDQVLIQRSYAYADNRPAIYTDPSGLVSAPIVGCALLLAATKCATHAGNAGLAHLEEGKDKLAHCVFHGVFTRCMMPIAGPMGAPAVSELLGQLWEVVQPSEGLKEDIAANRAGIGCAYSFWAWSITDCCKRRLKKL